jgi:hypothetical protein
MSLCARRPHRPRSPAFDANVRERHYLLAVETERLDLSVLLERADDLTCPRDCPIEPGDDSLLFL